VLNGNGLKSADQVLDEMDAGFMATQERETLKKATRQADLLARLDSIIALNALDRELATKELAQELKVRVAVVRELITHRVRGRNPFEHSNTPQESPTQRRTFDCSNECSNAFRIIEHSNTLRLVREAVKRLGYAGRTDTVELTYIALTSRLTDRPINQQILAPSAAGKNHALDTALAFFPPETFHKLTASSPRALVYTDEDFEHRSIVLCECDSLPEEGPAASAVRSIVADGEMSYEVVEKDPSTGKQGVRRILKKGPTNLITTGVKPLDAQMATRMLTVGILDTEEQTRAVLSAQGKQAAGASMPALSDAERDEFWAYQRWLGFTKGVVVPFGEQLAQLVPAGAVRMRRDFRQLLSVIKTFAIMHQYHREKTPDGMVVASVADYTEAHRLLVPVFDVIVAEGVSGAVRETVEAVAEGAEISVDGIGGEA
jgi:hypothetical protein